jgi:hypothetical protein
MSVLTFELTEDHIKLIKNLSWSLDENKTILALRYEEGEYYPSFGENDLYEGISLILDGKPDGLNPLDDKEMYLISEERKKYFDKIYSELPLALDVVLYTGKFETGFYKTRYHLRDWTKFDNEKNNK